MAPTTSAPPATNDVAEADAPLAVSAATTSNAFDSDGGTEGMPWPSDDSEALARADAAERGESIKVAVPSAEEEPAEKPAALPDLAQLVDRLPPQLKETLDDLFRARWVRVTRIKKRDLVS